MSLFSSKLIEENGFEAGQISFVLCFCAFLWPWPCTQHKLCVWATSQWKCFGYLIYAYSAQVEHETKDCAQLWTPQHKSWYFIYSIQFCHASQHLPSINYGLLIRERFLQNVSVREVGMWKIGVQEVTYLWIPCWF